MGEHILNGADKVTWYYTTLDISSISYIVIYKIVHSSIGMAFVARRDAEPLARSLGVNHYKHNKIVYGISAFPTGMIGALYAHYVNTISQNYWAWIFF